MENYERDTVDILGVYVDRMSFQDALSTVLSYLVSDKPHAVYTPNPEIIMHAYRNSAYKAVLNRADMVIPDGIGVVYGAKIVGKPVCERVAGFDLSCALLAYAGAEHKRLYLFGGKPGVAEKAAETILQKYPGIIVCGTAHGYQEDSASIADVIAESRADIVLVCLGAPKQELWIDTYKEKTGAKILIGAGGSLDVFAGTAKRAPAFFRKLNLEWMYRLLKQPSRAGRMLDLPRFAIKILLHGKRQKDTSRKG